MENATNNNEVIIIETLDRQGNWNLFWQNTLWGQVQPNLEPPAPHLWENGVYRCLVGREHQGFCVIAWGEVVLETEADEFVKVCLEIEFQGGDGWELPEAPGQWFEDGLSNL